MAISCPQAAFWVLLAGPLLAAGCLQGEAAVSPAPSRGAPTATIPRLGQDARTDPGRGRSPAVESELPTSETSTPAGGIPRPASLQTPPGPLAGLIVAESGDGKLLALRLDREAASVLPTGAPEGTLHLSPALSPDGRRLAFAAYAPGTVAARIRVMALEPAQESRVLLEPAEPRASQLFPAWSPDGGSLYFTEASPVVDAEGRIQGAEVWLSRVAASGGVPQRLVPDALFASLSADGSRLAFLRWSPAGGGTSIWVAGPEGEGGREVLPASGFVALHAPRISPNGRWIAFSAAPAEESRMSWLERLLRVRAAQAHGAPMLLYRFDLDRDELLPVTGWLEDDLAATWSPDGQWLAFQALEGKLVLADWRASALYLASAQAGRGLLAWGP